MSWYGRKHIWFECNERCEGCAYCNGGLSACRVCGALEGSLTATCPGVRVPEEQQDKVYKENHDFIGGVWCSPEAAQRIRSRLRAARLASELSQLREIK